MVHSCQSWAKGLWSDSLQIRNTQHGSHIYWSSLWQVLCIEFRRELNNAIKMIVLARHESWGRRVTDWAACSVGSRDRPKIAAPQYWRRRYRGIRSFPPKYTLTKGTFHRIWRRTWGKLSERLHKCVKFFASLPIILIIRTGESKTLRWSHGCLGTISLSCRCGNRRDQHSSKL